MHAPVQRWVADGLTIELEHQGQARPGVIGCPQYSKESEGLSFDV